MELTYGVERLTMYVQGVENVYDLDWNGLPKDRGGVSYGDVFHRAEVEYSHYNFNLADTDALFKLFEDAERECLFLLKAETSQVLPAYDQCIKASHRFNLLDPGDLATERQAYIGRVRTLQILLDLGSNPAVARTGRRGLEGWPNCFLNFYRKRFRPACKNARRKICDAW